MNEQFSQVLAYNYSNLVCILVNKVYPYLTTYKYCSSNAVVYHTRVKYIYLVPQEPLIYYLCILCRFVFMYL